MLEGFFGCYSVFDMSKTAFLNVLWQNRGVKKKDTFYHSTDNFFGKDCGPKAGKREHLIYFGKCQAYFGILSTYMA